MSRFKRVNNLNQDPITKKNCFMWFESHDLSQQNLLFESDLQKQNPKYIIYVWPESWIVVIRISQI